MKEKITVGYSRKLSHKEYGGKPYEMSDFYGAMEVETDKSVNKSVEKLYRPLYARLRHEIDQVVESEIEALKKAQSPEDKILEGKEKATYAQVKKIQDVAREKGVLSAELYALLQKDFEAKLVKDMTSEKIVIDKVNASRAIEHLLKLEKKEAEELPF